MSFWHSRPLPELVQELGTDLEAGLSSAEAARRLEESGPNELPAPAPDGYPLIFLRQFQSPLIYVLVVSAVAVWFIGETTDALLILAVLLFNAVIGAIQEGRAQNTLAALRKFVSTSATVLREGKEVIVPEKNVVPGDILVLEEGEKIAADARVAEAFTLQVEEAALTGESVPVFKEEKILPDRELPESSQSNMLFKGTAIVRGRGKALVVATGTQSVLGRISKTIAEVDTEIPLKRDIRALSRVLVWLVIGISVVIFVSGVYLGKSEYEMFATTISLAISIIPEGLPIVLTLILASGMWRMAKRNALVKKLQAVEALGQARVIAVDKTGTLTRNEMVVRRVYMDGRMFGVEGVGYESKGEVRFKGEAIDPAAHPELLLAGKIAAFCSNARIMFLPESETWKIAGDPTEAALLVFSHKMGFHRSELEREFPLVAEVPFDYHTKLHLVSHDLKNSKQFLGVTGAPESVLRLCTKIYRGGKTEPLDEAGVAVLRKRFEEMSSEGLRVVAAAHKEVPLTSEELNTENMIFTAYFGIEDSLRPEVPPSMARARAAGIKVVMITGDAKTTAIAIAREAGIWEEGKSVALTDEEIEKMSIEELQHAVSRASVFARITPEHKMRLIEAYKRRGEVIAMTGDGVNDAPPLVAADLGVAMGKIGTEVAKEASDIVLLDDNFGSIVSAVEEGRNMYRTIQKTLLFLFSTSLGEVLTIAGAIFMNIPIPLSAAQILWLNLVTDSFVAFALAMDNREKNLLTEFRNERFLFNNLMAWRMVLMSIPIAAGTLFLFLQYYEADLLRAWTVSLTALAAFQWLNGWNCRSEKESIFRGFFSNRYLLAGVGLAAGMQVLAVHWGPLQGLLRTVPLSRFDWTVILVVCSSIILVEEIRKYIVRRASKKAIHSPQIAPAGKPA